jgi:NADH:ubiquinone oxidoreductase subunit 4 (subunit M)
VQRVLLGRSPFAQDDHGHDDHSSVSLAKHDDHAHGYHDLSPIELAAAAPLVILSVILGFYPALLTPWIDGSAQALLETVKAVALR